MVMSAGPARIPGRTQLELVESLAVHADAGHEWTATAEQLVAAARAAGVGDVDIAEALGVHRNTLRYRYGGARVVRARRLKRAA